jgi:hypothetical protein
VVALSGRGARGRRPLSGRWLAAALGAAALAVALALVLAQDGRGRGAGGPLPETLMPLGVVGDSDSAASHDHVHFPTSGPQAPGGAYHPVTLQWPEVLARLRPDELSLGAWGVWGLPRLLSLGRLRDALGLPWRGPRAMTHRHNLAWASGCADLNEGGWRQVPRLVDLMDEQPGAWRRGAVVIRIGVNTFGKADDLDALARDPADPGVRARMDGCIAQLQRAVAGIRARHPDTRIVLVGIFNNAHWVPYHDRWHDPQALRRIDAGLDHFDNALRALARADARTSFFDDRAWFAQVWGGRDPATGRPAYRPVEVAPGVVVTQTAGDSPDHAVLANEHAGLAWNVLWSAALIEHLRTQAGLPLAPSGPAEAARFVTDLLTGTAPHP